MFTDEQLEQISETVYSVIAANVAHDDYGLADAVIDRLARSVVKELREG